MEGASEIYSDFNDLIPNENPLSDNGNWVNLLQRPPLKVNSTATGIHGTVEFAVNGSLYVGKVFNGPIIEAYGCRPESGLGAALESHRIVALIGNPDNYTGYSSGFGGGIGESYFFRMYSSFAFTPIGDNGAADGGTGVGGARPQKLGIRILPDRVQQWGYHTVAGGWFLVQTHFGNEHRGPTRIALETEEQGGLSEVSWGCLFGVAPNRTQIYRIVRA